MGFFGKKDLPEDAIENAPDMDTEKQQPVHNERDEGDHAALPLPIVEIDPAVERRMLRKMDCRVPVLLGFLCESLTEGCLWPCRIAGLTIRWNNRCNVFAGPE